ncbi:hypothetical protein RHS03_04429, partial [Rhizoctonia solani]
MRCILSFVVLYCTILTALAVPISPPPVPDLKQTDPTEGYAYIKYANVALKVLASKLTPSLRFSDIHLAPEDSTGARLLSGSSVYRHGDVIHGYSDYQQPLHYARVVRTIFVIAVTITVRDALAIDFPASSGCVASNCDDTSAHISSNVNATDVPTGH